MYEIRGLSLSYIYGQHILNILLRGTSNGFYINFKYNLTSLPQVAPVLNFLKDNLQCELKDITIARHVSFEKVGITK
ncbi:hypothetical protein LCGC14_0807910 [marine sediment metagenome]|uniref:Uncharacterized protein n=1 Tax=marine sediment metagenome TaxID=412755 RepID=A0A0F9Q7P0_9ZZZZ